MELMTQADYARHRGVSRQAVNKAVRDKKIPLHDGKIDAAEADLALGANVERVRVDDLPLPRSDAAASLSSGLTRAKTFEAVYDGRMAELKYHREVGKVRPVEDVQIGAQRCAEVVLRALSRITGRADEMAALVAKDGVLGARTCLRNIDRDLRKVVAEEFSKLAAGQLVEGQDAEAEST